MPGNFKPSLLLSLSLAKSESLHSFIVKDSHQSPVPLVLVCHLTKWPLSLRRDERKVAALFPEASDQMVGWPSQTIRLLVAAIVNCLSHSHFLLCQLTLRVCVCV